MIQALSMCLSMERLSACIKRQAAQKGDSQSSHRTLERRIDHQGSGPGGRPWQSGLPGQRSEIVGVAWLIEGLTFGAFLGDKAFDADHLRDALHERGAQVVIPAR